MTEDEVLPARNKPTIRHRVVVSSRYPTSYNLFEAGFSTRCFRRSTQKQMVHSRHYLRQPFPRTSTGGQSTVGFRNLSSGPSHETSKALLPRERPLGAEAWVSTPRVRLPSRLANQRSLQVLGAARGAGARSNSRRPDTAVARTAGHAARRRRQVRVLCAHLLRSAFFYPLDLVERNRQCG